MRPVALLLDVMDTLVWDPYRLIPEFLGSDWTALGAARDPRAWIEFEEGRIDEDAFFDRFFTDDRPLDRQGLRALMFDNYRWLPGMEDLLGELRDSGIAMHALSNYPCWYQGIEERLGLSRYLDWRFVSCLTGHRKPASAAYIGAANALGRAPAECLFVDDRLGNVTAAQRCGLQAIRYEGADALREALVGLSVLGATRPQSLKDR